MKHAFSENILKMWCKKVVTTLTYQSMKSSEPLMIAKNSTRYPIISRTKIVLISQLNQGTREKSSLEINMTPFGWYTAIF